MSGGMKFVLLVEGATEAKVLQGFFKRWLDRNLNQPVGIHTENLKSNSNLIKDAAALTRDYLNAPDGKQIIAVVSLLDLSGLDGTELFPDVVAASPNPCEDGKREMERRVGDARYRHFFAVHELEAWLLSQPELFHQDIQKYYLKKITEPEKVNHNKCPSKLLNELYRNHLNRDYKKTVDGAKMFASLDPSIAYEKCPHLKMMLDEMLRMAHAAGL